MCPQRAQRRQLKENVVGRCRPHRKFMPTSAHARSARDVGSVEVAADGNRSAKTITQTERALAHPDREVDCWQSHGFCDVRALEVFQCTFWIRVSVKEFFFHPALAPLTGLLTGH